MKSDRTVSMIAALATATLVISLVAATVAVASGEPPPDRPPGEPRQPPRPPLMAALDADQNGILSAEEIANASAALKALDKDGDGQLSPAEWMGRRPAFRRDERFRRDRGPGPGRPGGPDGNRPDRPERPAPGTQPAPGE